MFWTEFVIFDQGGNSVFIRKTGNPDSYCGCSKGGPGQEQGKKGGDSLGPPWQGVGEPWPEVTDRRHRRLAIRLSFLWWLDEETGFPLTWTWAHGPPTFLSATPLQQSFP